MFEEHWKIFHFIKFCFGIVWTSQRERDNKRKESQFLCDILDVFGNVALGLNVSSMDTFTHLPKLIKFNSNP